MKQAVVGLFVFISIVAILSGCMVKQQRSGAALETTQSEISSDKSAPATPTTVTDNANEQSMDFAPDRSEPSQAPIPIYIFHDQVIQRSVEQHLDKSANELTSEDLEHLSQQLAFYFYTYNGIVRNVRSLRDIPVLFPHIRYINIALSIFDEAQLTVEDCQILEGIPSLRAVDIYSNGLPDLRFVHNLRYASLRYSEDAYLSDKNNLAEASVLGKDFIENHVTGNIKEYVKVEKNERVYELIVTDNEQFDSDSWFISLESMVFISEKRDGEYNFVTALSVPGRIGNASGGLILTDVNFDGNNDILVKQGRFGTQAFVKYDCYLDSGGTYVYSESFSEIKNPSLDVLNHKVLSTGRITAVSHSWAMYSYVNGEFTMTDLLTTAPEVIGEMMEDGLGYEIEVWGFTTERFSNGKIESEVYLTSDYTDDEIMEMFYYEDSYWGLFSDKWRTLYNQGTLMDWSIYGSRMDAQIFEIITK